MLWLIMHSGDEQSSNNEQKTTSGSFKDEPDSVGRAEVLKDPGFWLIIPAVLTPPFVITGIFIHQPFILEAKNWTPAWFATSLVFYGTTYWTGSLIAGWLVDLFTGRKVVGFIYYLCLWVAYCLLFFLTNS